MDAILARLAYIALGLLALAGVGVASVSAFSANKASQMVTDISHLITNARSGFAQNGKCFA